MATNNGSDAAAEWTVEMSYLNRVGELVDVIGTCLQTARSVAEKKRERKEYLRKRHENGVYFAQFITFKNYERSSVQGLLRLSAQQFDGLVGRVAMHMRSRHWNCKISLQERILLCFDYMCSGQSLHRLAMAYGISLGSVSIIIKEVTEAVVTALRNSVHLPSNAEEWKAIADTFYANTGLPNCLAAIDGKHIRVKAPKNSGSENFNYKKHFSFVLLALVDSRRRFLYYDIGANGANNDAHVFQTSTLYQLFQSNSANLPTPTPLPGSDVILPYYIAGDGAFGLRTWLLKPIDGRHLRREEDYFNWRFSKGRGVVENAFGVLATRFRLLYTPIDMKPATIMNIVRAMVHIHNYLTAEDVGDLNEEMERYNGGMLEEIIEPLDDVFLPDGQEVRNRLLQYFIAGRENAM